MKLLHRKLTNINYTITIKNIIIIRNITKIHKITTIMINNNNLMYKITNYKVITNIYLLISIIGLWNIVKNIGKIRIN